MKAIELQRRLLAPCRNPNELHEWVRLFLGYNIPRRSVCECHDPPFDYLVNAYFEPAGDMIVWAPRGGGKTRLAAVATLLDLLHKPGVSVRILGGSLEQSLKMWEHLVPDLERLVPDLLQKKQIQSRRLRLKNGSTCAVLTQSQRAIRGLRVQKLRCDEVELFDEDVWEAAQLVTRSSSLPLPVLRDGARGESSPASSLSAPNLSGLVATSRISGKDRVHRILPLPCPAPGVPQEGIKGTIEALSTHHRRFGLMGKLLDLAESQHKPRVVKWCLMDVLQRCPVERDCKACPLWDDCGGVAKSRCDGFIPIDDAIALKQRVSAECWAAEMMCRKPSVRGCVFPSFDPSVHVCQGSGFRVQGSTWSNQDSQDRILNSNAPRAECEPSERSDSALVLAIDFGFANPFVCLWIRATGVGERVVVHVIDEYVQQGQPMDVHLTEIAARRHGPIAWAGCDPAGNGRNDQTAASNVTLLRRAGYRVRFRASRIVDGVEMIRAALCPAASVVSNAGTRIIGRSTSARLFVHPRCAHLMAALRGYRYAESGSELPLKDGEHDHLIDALRYFFVNNTDNRVIVSKY